MYFDWLLKFGIVCFIYFLVYENGKLVVGEEILV